MKILYVCHEPLPSPQTNTEQAVKTLAALSVESNIRIDLLCPRGSGRAADRLSHLKNIADTYGIPREIFDSGVNLIERPIPFFIPGRIRLLAHDISSVRFAAQADYDLVVTRDPLTLAFMLARGNKTVFETYRCDLNTAAIYGWWRKFCIPHNNLAGVVTHSDKARRLFMRSGMPADKVITAYNGGIFRPQTAPMARKDARKTLGWPDEANILVYAGHINRRKGIDTLIGMAGLLENFQIVLVGGLPGSSGFKKTARRIARRGLRNMSLVPRVQPSEVSMYLAAADLLLIPPTIDPLVKYQRTVLPIKIFRYLTAGRPILAPQTSDIQEVLKNRRNAILVPPDSIPEAAGAVRELFDNNALRDHLSQNAFQDSKAYSWRRRGKILDEFIAMISR